MYGTSEHAVNMALYKLCVLLLLLYDILLYFLLSVLFNRSNYYSMNHWTFMDDVWW